MLRQQMIAESLLSWVEKLNSMGHSGVALIFFFFKIVENRLKSKILSASSWSGPDRGVGSPEVGMVGRLEI